MRTWPALLSQLSLMVLPVATSCVKPAGTSPAMGGPVLGPVDSHCYVGEGGTSPGGPIAPQFTDEAACPTTATLFADGGPPPDEIGCGLFGDGGPAGCTPACDFIDGGPAGCDPEYGATLYNNSGNDDDCKYQVAWWSSPITQGANTTFYFTALNAVDGTPAAGAHVFAEVFLPSENHVSPSTNPPVAETPMGSGVYTIGPVVFDRSGQWTVRFHLHEDCEDLLPDSPHGHAAFYVNVP